MKQEDPLYFLFETFKPDFSRIKEIFAGKKYLYVRLKNENIGVSANIGNLKSVNENVLNEPDFNNIEFRQICTAYFNATLNNTVKISEENDIFKIINFSTYKKTVMIGYSEPMYKKLVKTGNEPSVFDFSANESFIKDQNSIKSCLQKADSLIVTGTVIINNTFSEIFSEINENCDAFLIGPSATLSDLLSEKYNIKGIFGTLFENNKNIVTNLIKEGKGTDFLKKYGKKVALLKK